MSVPMTRRYLVDLVALALGTDSEGSTPVEEQGPKDSRLAAVLAAIQRRSCDPAFDLDGLAQRHGISRRYIQHLLEQTGRSFSEHVGERRLKQAFRCCMIRAPRIFASSTSRLRDCVPLQPDVPPPLRRTPSRVRAARGAQRASRAVTGPVLLTPARAGFPPRACG